MAHFDIYREQLATTHSQHGYALWSPTPVEVGDVGLIRNGKFHRLFNALRPEGHPSNIRFGVPEFHEQLIPRFSDMNKGTLKRNHYYSSGINVTNDSESDLLSEG